MIVTKDLTTSVEFGSDGIGTMSLIASGNKLDGGFMTVQQLKMPVEIGTKPEPEQIHPLPKIVMHFNDPKSIDSMIEVLIKAKEFMGRLPENTLAYAC